MNILGIFLVNQIRTGGDRRYLELMEALASRSNTVVVIMNAFFDYTPQHLKKIELNIKYKRHSFPPGSYLFKKNIKTNLENIISHCSEYGVSFFDFIHIHGDMHLKSAIFLKKALRIPLFYACRNNDVERDRIIMAYGKLPIENYIFLFLYSFINRSRERQIARFSELITFQSAMDMGDFQKRTNCEKSKIIIIPGNIGPPRFSSEWQNKNNSMEVKKLLYVGSAAPNKGLLELLKSLGLLKTKGFNGLQCQILARVDNLEHIMKLVRELNIEDMVCFEGYKDPFPFLATCDLMVYPVLYDAFPDTVLEALHTGCPVIASAVGGLPDMLQYPELLFNPHNIQQIADKIAQCVIDKNFYNYIRQLCKERAKVYHFDWAEKFENAMIVFKKRKKMEPSI
jgi:glycosyltransferase involved in cell wall biosynthesis